MHIQEHDARGQRLAPFARPTAGSTADSARGALAAAQAGEIVALSIARPAALVASLSAALEAGAVPLVLPPGLPLEAARRVAAEVGARYLRWQHQDQNQAQNQAHDQELSGRSVLAFQGYLACTSGTTSGVPKVYAFRTEVARENARAHLESIGGLERSGIVLPMPLSHSFGLVAGWLAAEAAACPLIAFTQTPDPATLLRVVAEEGADTLYLTPPLARLLLKGARRRAPLQPPTLRALTVGSAGMGRAELLALRALFPSAQLYFTYGQTELGPRVSTLHVTPDNLPEKQPVSIGRPLRGVRLRVSGGTLQVASPYVSAGRVVAGGLQALCQAPHGFQDTHDAATCLDESRHEEPAIAIHGRADGVMVRGGTNVYPEDVEACANALEGVAASVCVPRDSAMYGEVPVLIVERSADPAASSPAPALGPAAGEGWPALKEAIRAQLARSLPPTSHPVEIHHVPRLPRTSLGKVVRAGALALVDAPHPSSEPPRA